MLSEQRRCRHKLVLNRVTTELCQYGSFSECHQILSFQICMRSFMVDAEMDCIDRVWKFLGHANHKIMLAWSDRKNHPDSAHRRQVLETIMVELEKTL